MFQSTPSAKNEWRQESGYAQQKLLPKANPLLQPHPLPIPESIGRRPTCSLPFLPTQRVLFTSPCRQFDPGGVAHHAPLLSRSQCAEFVRASASFEQLLVASIGHGQRKRGTIPFIGFTTSKAHRPPDDGFAAAMQNQGAHSEKGTAEDLALNDLFSPCEGEVSGLSPTPTTSI